MKITEIRIIALLILQTLCLGTSVAAEPASPPLNEEIAKQEMIYRSQGDQVPDGYIIDRSLLSYIHTLSAEFDRALAALGPNDRWLDIGAGRGQAILDYYAPRYDRMHYDGRERPDKKARAVAISIEDRRTPAWQLTAASLGTNQIQYLFSRRLREYALEELGQFQVITDVIGGFSYTSNLSVFMEQVLGLLSLNGNFFTVLPDVHAEDGSNKPYYAGSPFLTEIANTDGSEVKICSWLKRITCVEVICEFKAQWQPPVEAIRVHKVCNDVKVPELAAVHFEAGTPPERRFQLRN
jgi:SAM-dependent methyltransferase